MTCALFAGEYAPRPNPRTPSNGTSTPGSNGSTSNPASATTAKPSPTPARHFTNDAPIAKPTGSVVSTSPEARALLPRAAMITGTRTSGPNRTR